MLTIKPAIRLSHSNKHERVEKNGLERNFIHQSTSDNWRILPSLRNYQTRPLRKAAVTRLQLPFPGIPLAFQLQLSQGCPVAQPTCVRFRFLISFRLWESSIWTVKPLPSMYSIQPPQQPQVGGRNTVTMGFPPCTVCWPTSCGAVACPEHAPNNTTINRMGNTNLDIFYPFTYQLLIKSISH
jgi:hypothetical protein